MGFSWLLPIRFVMTVSAFVLGAAILLGRTSHSTPPEIRVRSLPLYAPVNQQLINAPHTLMLDTERGELVPITLGHSRTFNSASFSPWRDDQGHSSVAGFWMYREADRTPSDGSLVFSLARFTFPGGSLLEQAEVNFFPASAPCWSPDATGRILVAGWDGQLYRFDFGQGTWDRDGSNAEFLQRPLKWQNLRPGELRPMVEDTIWPSEPRLAGLLISVVIPDGHTEGFSQRRISWLRLGPDASSIEATGDLASPRSGGRAIGWPDERMPCVSAMPDGDLALAYLVKLKGTKTWRLQLARLEFDPETATPRFDRANEVTLAEECAMSPPAFSPDGRWVFSLAYDPHHRLVVRRHSVVDALPSTPTRAGHVATTQAKRGSGLIE